jgi:hypothetical protein
MAKQEDVQQYYGKSFWIKTAIITLRQSGLIADSLTDPNLDRVMKTNEQNLMLLTQFRWQPEELGRMTFWACRKTVDMNFNTMRRALERHGINPDEIM